ncbi:unnamed protein product [Rotaria socialis]
MRAEQPERITTTTVATTVSLPSQCSNYTLDTDATRLLTYTIVTWVRFTGGGATQLATTTPQTYRCATSATGWLVSALPSTVGSVVSGLVCFNWSSSICYWSTTISVANFKVPPLVVSLKQVRDDERKSEWLNLEFHYWVWEDNATQT